MFSVLHYWLPKGVRSNPSNPSNPPSYAPGYRFIEVNLERKLRRAVCKNLKRYPHGIKIVYMLIINKYRARHLQTSIKRTPSINGTLWLTMTKRKISRINISQCWWPINHILWLLGFIFGRTTGYLLDLSDFFDIKNWENFLILNSEAISNRKMTLKNSGKLFIN